MLKHRIVGPDGYLPTGEWTQGKTHPNRLRRLDTWCLRRRSGWLQTSGLAVDVGFGRQPWSTIEWAHRLPETLDVVGLEIDPHRVASAREQAPHIRWVHGGLERNWTRPVQLVRAMNVRRTYRHPVGVLEAWGSWLQPGGILIEGTSDKFGRVLCADFYCASEGELGHQGLLLSTSFRDGFAPQQFYPRLPRRCSANASPFAEFFEAWIHHFKQGRLRSSHPRDVFRHSARALCEDFPVMVDPHGWRLGQLFVSL